VKTNKIKIPASIKDTGTEIDRVTTLLYLFFAKETSIGAKYTVAI